MFIGLIVFWGLMCTEVILSCLSVICWIKGSFDVLCSNNNEKLGFIESLSLVFQSDIQLWCWVDLAGNRLDDDLCCCMQLFGRYGPIKLIFDSAVSLPWREVNSNNHFEVFFARNSQMDEVNVLFLANLLKWNELFSFLINPSHFLYNRLSLRYHG